MRNMRTSLRTLAGAAALGAAIALASPAMAGPQYVDSSGFAASGYDVVAYQGLQQSPVGQAQPKAVAGRADLTAEWNGATWAFASEENRSTFLADPAKYAPQYDGHCAYGIAKGGKVAGNPHLWRVVDGKLYLNINPAVVGFFEEDIAGNLATAQSNWPGMENAPASDMAAAPEFDTSLAPVKN